MIKQIFSCAPKVKLQKKEETIPLALASVAFTKDLRAKPSETDAKKQQIQKKEVKNKPKVVKLSKKPVQKAPAIVKRATLTLLEDDFRKECNTPKEQIELE